MGSSEDYRPRSLSEESDSTERKRARFTKPSSATSVGPDAGLVSESDGQESDSGNFQFSKEETNRNESRNPKFRASVNNLWLIGLVLIIIASVALHLLTKQAHSSPDALMARLQESFPGQSVRLWAVLNATITAETRSSASLKMDAVIEGSPKVLLISPSADLANYDRYREFLRSFEDSLAHLNKQWKCVDIDPFKSLSDTSPDNIKRYVYHQMEIAYQNNQQCLHIVAIDRLPGDAAVAFHGTTDPLSSPFRNAFLLFSINRPPKFPNRTSQRDMEKHLRRHLRLLWEGDLGGDEASALINRLTVRIGIFKV